MQPNLSIVGLCAFLLAAGVAAQSPKVIKLNGQIYDTNGGPFKRGNVYLIISNGAGCCGIVPDGKTLTIERGAIVKFQGNSLTVAGRLIARGATFTSEKDDTIGGDTNGDGGKSQAKKGDWDRITFGFNGNGIVEDCTFRYGGSNGSMTIHIRNSKSILLNRCKIEQGGGDGLSAENSIGLKMTGCEVRSCEGIAVVNWAFDRLENASNNRASGNKKGDYIRYHRRSNAVWPGTTITMARSHSMNGNGIFVLKVAPALVAQVPRNHKLVVPAGSILKFMRNGLLTVSGNLQVGGGGSPVIFTSFHDDVGGDTNKSTQQPLPGDWQGIHFEQYSDASLIVNTQVTYAGVTNLGAVKCSASGVTFNGLSVSRSKSHGVTVIPNLYSKPAFLNCTFANNNGHAAHGLTWASVARSHNNQANNNTLGDYFQVQGHVVQGTQQLDIRPENYPGPAVVLLGRTDFRTGSRLTLHAGTVVKVTPRYNHGFSNAFGTLECLGTAKARVVVTSFHDDSIGGDTDKNGTTTVAKPGDWAGILLGSQSSGRLEHTLVRYASGSSGAAVNSSTSRAFLDSVRIDHAGGHGILITNYNKTLHNIVVYKAGQIGINAGRGTYDVHHATVTGCGGVGINKGGGFNGNVHNCISWNNTGGNFAWFTQAMVHNSNGGFAGKNGNISTDPRFVNVSTGDLHLASSSPCLDKAGMAAALATKKDHEEFSRILDHGLTGAALPDMGAYERSVYSLKVTGQAMLGQRLTLQIQGPAGDGKLLLGFLNGEVFLPPFGIALLGTNPLIFLNSGPVPTTTSAVVPNDKTLVGIKFGIQGIAATKANPLVGGVTDLCRFEVR